MTERDLIKQVVEQSITLMVDVEELRKWAKVQYARVSRFENCDLSSYDVLRGEAHAYGRLIQKLDEIERGGKV